MPEKLSFTVDSLFTRSETGIDVYEHNIYDLNDNSRGSDAVRFVKQMETPIYQQVLVILSHYPEVIGVSFSYEQGCDVVVGVNPAQPITETIPLSIPIRIRSHQNGLEFSIFVHWTCQIHSVH